MNKLMIIHFQPLELYPPVMNLLNRLSEIKDGSLSVVVCSMKDDTDGALFVPASPAIRTLRRGTIYKKQHTPYNLLRYVGYGLFYLSALLRLLRFRPRAILYYDTLSFLPAYLYKKYFNRKVSLLAHYHEYTSLAEYEQGMLLNRVFHGLEKEMFPQFRWVSHTNEDRMRKFLEDHHSISILHTHILPNYPPLSWKRTHHPANPGVEHPVKIIYVGALSSGASMYTRNFAEWVVRQGNKVVWHIYSTNISAETVDYIQSLHTDNIKFMGGVPYEQLPDIISRYDVGVILYTGHIPNYVYNAPNKLFEYVACGLDVWFPEVLKGSLPYRTRNSFPKVLALDFQHLSREDPDQLINKSGLVHRPSTYFSEIALAPLVDTLLHISGSAVERGSTEATG